ncbi:MAG: heme exporter protein CcmB [Firmicutes bacterium]|nr:heme exporter protein CcmB [Bacillota bacterium]
MKEFLSAVGAIVWKDLKAEFRTKEMISSMLIFAFLVIVIFSFAFDPTAQSVKKILPGVIWVAFIFAGTLGLNRSFLSEQINEAIQGLMLAPVDRAAIYFGKVLGNMIYTSLVEAVALPVFIILFDFSFSGSWLSLILVVVASTFGFVAVGTFLAALASNTRTSEVLLPIILFPVIVPVIIGAVEMTKAIFAGSSLGEVATWLRVVLVYDVVFLVIPFLLFDFLLEA